MKKILKKTGRFFLWFFGILLLIACFPYLWHPVYIFPETEKFSGEFFYNPYENIDSSKWLTANFHAHTRSWGGLTNGSSSDKDLIKAYKSLGYDITGISNYHRISE